jgi:hypothetical protein
VRQLKGEMGSLGSMSMPATGQSPRAQAAFTSRGNR